MTVVFSHVGSVNVVETTYFGIAFIFWPKSSPVILGHASAKPS